MTKLLPSRMFRFPIVLALLLVATITVGCSHKKTNRGHLFRCDWAFEYNRTPWVGCPPESGCYDERGCDADDCCECDSGGKPGLFDCLKRDSGKRCSCKSHKNKGFRRHCGMNPECTAKRPCCRTLGCGMWIDPSDPNTFATLGSGVKACGLTAFCSPMKPCCLTPHCGRTVNPSFMNQQMLMLGNTGMPAQGMPAPVMPTPATPKTEPGKENKKPTTVAGPTGMLISRGIVPGMSPITGGGIVAAPGVTTSAGMMTPAGVRLPNGMVNANAVIRACGMPGCSATRPCAATPGCGMLVSVAAIPVNPMMLASGMYANGNVMQTGAVPGYTANGGMMTAGGIPTARTGNGMLVNPVTGQPIAGLTMSGFPQNGYPPIGYAPTGYSPGYPRYAAEMEAVEVEEEEPEEPVEEEKSPMPVPRFHPIPSKPVFQRSEGMSIPQGTAPAGKRSAANNSRRIFSDEAIDAAIEQAYLEGMSDAMDEVEEEFETQAQELAKAQLQKKILSQAKKLQTQIDSQKELELQALEMREFAQEQARKQAREQARRQAVQEQAAVAAALEVEAAQNRQWQTQLPPQSQRTMQAQIPSRVISADQSVSPVNYNAAGPEKNIFASAVQFLKGNDTPTSAPTAAMPVPYMPQYAAQQQFAQQQRNAAVAYPNGMRPSAGQPSVLESTGARILGSAKSMGDNVLSTVSEAVSPLSGLLGSETPPLQQGYPQNYQQGPIPVRTRSASVPGPSQHFSELRIPSNPSANLENSRHAIYPCPRPPCPPFSTNKALASAPTPLTDDAEIGFSSIGRPQKPTTIKKKPKRMIEVDDPEDENVILQANYIEE